MRIEIKEFAKEMERIMKLHDGTKGDTWKDCSIFYLMKKLDEEVDEFCRLKEKAEIVDVANICMMLWHRIKEASK